MAKNPQANVAYSVIETCGTHRPARHESTSGIGPPALRSPIDNLPRSATWHRGRSCLDCRRYKRWPERPIGRAAAPAHELPGGEDPEYQLDGKSVAAGKSVSVRVDRGGVASLKKKRTNKQRR